MFLSARVTYNPQKSSKFSRQYLKITRHLSEPTGCVYNKPATIEQDETDGTSYQKLQEEPREERERERERERETRASKHIGYIPRDLSRDNWQICRAEVNDCGNERSLETRQKAGKISFSFSSLVASEFQIFHRETRDSISPLPFPLSVFRCTKRRASRFGNSRNTRGFCDSTLTRKTRPLCVDLSSHVSFSASLSLSRSPRVPISLDIRGSVGFRPRANAGIDRTHEIEF